MADITILGVADPAPATNVVRSLWVESDLPIELRIAHQPIPETAEPTDLLTRDEFSEISYRVYRRVENVDSLVAGYESVALTISDVISATGDLPVGWGRDGVGYNFRHVVPAAAFAANCLHLVLYRFVVDGETRWHPVLVHVEGPLGSGGSAGAGTITGDPGPPGADGIIPGIINLLDYDADPEGIADSLAAFEAAKDAAALLGRGAWVVAPPGVYRLSAQFLLDESDQTWSGYGAKILQGGTLGATDSSSLFRITGNRNRILGFEIDGNAAAQYASRNRLVQINGTNPDTGSYNVLRDLYLHDSYDHASQAQTSDLIQIVNGTENTVENCHCVNAGWNGIRVSGDGNHVKGCQVINYLGRGIRFNGGESGFVSDCHVRCEDIAAGACILVDPETGALFGHFEIRDCTVYNDSTRAPGTNAIKIARVKFAVISGGDYQIGPTQPTENSCIRLEDTVERCRIENLRCDAILMTAGLFQGVITGHASANAGAFTTFTVDPASLSTDPDFDAVSDLLAGGKTVFISGSGVPSHNTQHTVTEHASFPPTATTFTVETPFVAGTVGTAIGHDATDRLTIRNVTFGHGIHTNVGSMENIKARIIDIEGCFFDLRNDDATASTGATTAIEWAVPDDRAFELFRLVGNEAIFAKASAEGKLVNPENTSTMLLTSGKVIAYENRVRNIEAGGTAVVVNDTGAANRNILFSTDGESTHRYRYASKPDATDLLTQFTPGDEVSISDTSLRFVCSEAGAAGVTAPVFAVRDAGYRFTSTAAGTAVADFDANEEVSATAETGIGSLRFGGNRVLQIGEAVRCFASGVFSTSGTPNLNFGFAIGKSQIGNGAAGSPAGTAAETGRTKIAETGAFATASGASNLRWRAEVTIRVLTIGGSGTVQVTGLLEYETAAGVWTSIKIGPTTVTVNTSNTSHNRKLDIWAAWGTKSASNTFTCQQFENAPL